jgi:hypothetical protein|tara:strand:- start:1540 stop:1728 length:189 start_codon:yes stop_codon:yes gene_type:complete
MKLDLKTIITIGVLLVPLVGFYYTTNMRLDAIESKVETMQAVLWPQVKHNEKTEKRKRKKKK